MRPILLFSILPIINGCGLLFGEESDRQYCDSYVECIAEAEPTLLDQTEAFYGDGGQCWRNGRADDCEEACHAGLDAMADLHPTVSTCTAGSGGPNGASFVPQGGMYVVSPMPPHSDRCRFDLYVDMDWTLTLETDTVQIDTPVYLRPVQCNLDNPPSFRCPEARTTGRLDSYTTLEFYDTYQATWTSPSTFEGTVSVELVCMGGCWEWGLDHRCEAEFPIVGTRQ